MKLRRRLGARSRCCYCLDPSPPLRGGTDFFTSRRNSSEAFLLPPPSVGGLDLSSSNSGCACLGSGVVPPFGVVEKEVAVLVVLVRRHRCAVGAVVRRVDGATSTCALGEGLEAFVNQTAIPHLPTRHVSTNGSKDVYSREQNRAIHEPLGSHLAVCQPAFHETATLAPGRRQCPHCQGPQTRKAAPPRQPSNSNGPRLNVGLRFQPASVGAGM